MSLQPAYEPLIIADISIRFILLQDYVPMDFIPSAFEKKKSYSYFEPFIEWVIQIKTKDIVEPWGFIYSNQKGSTDPGSRCNLLLDRSLMEYV